MKARQLFVVSSVVAALTPACAADPAPPRDRQNVTPVPPAIEPEPEEDEGRDLDVARPAFQAKSSAQLARSVEACVGRGALAVDAAMIATPENASGFLTSDFVADSDIVEVQKLLFDGTAEAMRTGVRVDQVSLEYITALKNVANVVGRRCAGSLVETPALCACESIDDAKAMLGRCLAAVADPTTPEFASLAGDFQQACSTNRGSAIASMIASLAFAKVP